MKTVETDRAERTVRGTAERTVVQRNLVRRVRRELAGVRNVIHLQLRLANLVCRFLPAMSLGTFRAAVYRWAGFRIDCHVSMGSAMTIIGGGNGIYARLVIGQGSLIGYRPLFNLDDDIRIGRNVALGPNVSIYTSSHLLGPASRRMNLGVITRPVVIEDGAWIGVGCIILPGVVVGRGCVVSAGAVVSESMPPNMLVMGNPAKAVQELPWSDD